AGGGGGGPGVCAAQGDGRQFGTDLAEKRRQADLRKKLGHRLANIGVGGPEELFGLAYVRPAFEQGGGQPGGALRRHPLRKKRDAPLDRAGQAAQQNAELIFSEHNLLLDVRQSSGGVGQRGFGAIGLQLGSHAAFKTLREDFQTVAEGIGGAAGHLELLVQLQQTQIRGGNVAQQTERDPASRLFGREELRAGGFV